LRVQDVNEFIAQKISILQVIICDDLRRGSMLNSGNNNREQNWVTVKSKGEESPVRLAGDFNPWISKMGHMSKVPLFLIDQGSHTRLLQTVILCKIRVTMFGFCFRKDIKDHHPNAVFDSP
jgi:hypothetical protein